MFIKGYIKRSSLSLVLCLDSLRLGLFENSHKQQRGKIHSSFTGYINQVLTSSSFGTEECQSQYDNTHGDSETSNKNYQLPHPCFCFEGHKQVSVSLLTQKLEGTMTYWISFHAWHTKYKKWRTTYCFATDINVTCKYRCEHNESLNLV